jgi:membrane glycosyltransferase
VFLLLTLVSTVLATSIFADMQPDYDNAWLQYGQITLFALLSAWVVTGFMTAMMGFYVTIFGDKHALSSNKVQHYPLDASTRTAIIMPICNEDVRTVFAGLRATCESVAMTGHVKSFDVFVLSDSNNPAIIQAERAAWEDLRTQLAGHPSSRRSRCTTACASAAPTARPATWPTSAAAGARTTATWWCWTPTA